MKKISLDYSKIFKFINEDELNQMKILVDEAAHKLHNKNGAGNDFLGWLDLPINYDKEEFSKIKKASDKIKADSEVLVVIGIGGSYLGARAVIECLSHTFFNSLNKEKRNAFFILLTLAIFYAYFLTYFICDIRWKSSI